MHEHGTGWPCEMLRARLEALCMQYGYPHVPYTPHAHVCQVGCDPYHSCIILLSRIFLQGTRERARDVLEKYADALLDEYSEITAMDIGYREKGGVEQKGGDVCLLIWVEKKLPKSKLEETGRHCLPPVYEGIAVDVREGQVMFVVCCNISH